MIVELSCRWARAKAHTHTPAHRCKLQLSAHLAARIHAPQHPPKQIIYSLAFRVAARSIFSSFAFIALHNISNNICVKINEKHTTTHHRHRDRHQPPTANHDSGKSAKLPTASRYPLCRRSLSARLTICTLGRFRKSACCVLVQCM